MPTPTMLASGGETAQQCKRRRGDLVRARDIDSEGQDAYDTLAKT